MILQSDINGGLCIEGAKGFLFIDDGKRIIHSYESVVIDMAIGKLSEDQFKKLRKVEDTQENFSKELRRF